MQNGAFPPRLDGGYGWFVVDEKETENESLDNLLEELISDIYKSFKAFVPKRLDSQINQWVSCYVQNIIGFVAEELILRGILEKPDIEKPLVNGVFGILGEYVNV